MIYLLLFLLFNAVAPIIIHFWGNDINSDILIFISAITAIVCFHLLNIGRNIETYRMVVKNKAIWTNLSKAIGTTTFMWGVGFIIPIVFSPFIFVFSYLGLPSLFGAIVMARNTKNSIYYIQATMIAITFVMFYYMTFSSYSSVKMISGIIVTLLTGLSLYLYLRISKSLNFQGINSRQILALRYWLLLLLPLLLISYRHEFNLITLPIIGKCILIGIITLVLPLYFGQLCIEKFGSENSSLTMGFIPIITFFLQLLIMKTDIMQVIIAMFLALSIALPILVSKFTIAYKAKKSVNFVS